MPRLKTYLRIGLSPNQRGKYYTNKKTGKAFFIPAGGRIRSVRPWYPRGHGSRLVVRYRKYIDTPELARIKTNQARAERRAGIRVGNALFANPLASEPVVVGVVKYERKKQQNPANRKIGYQRKGKDKEKRGRGRRSTRFLGHTTLRI